MKFYHFLAFYTSMIYFVVFQTYLIFPKVVFFLTILMLIIKYNDLCNYFDDDNFTMFHFCASVYFLCWKPLANNIHYTSYRVWEYSFIYCHEEWESLIWQRWRLKRSQCKKNQSPSPRHPSPTHIGHPRHLGMPGLDPAGLHPFFTKKHHFQDLSPHVEWSHHKAPSSCHCWILIWTIVKIQIICI